MKNSEQSAFPAKGTTLIEEFGIVQQVDVYFCGLTKREYFAAMAMQGLLANSSNSIYPTEVAQDSLIYADALLAELEKTNSNE